MEPNRPNKIDLTIVWNDAKAMARANRDLLTAIAGMFVLLPSIVSEQLVVAPARLAERPTDEQMLARYADYFTANWPVLLGHALVTSFAALALFALLLRPERLTVGESLRAGLVVLPTYFVASVVQGLGVMAGLFLFLVPGFYLIGRFALIAPVAAAEQTGNPLAILRRSAELTHGNGWRIFGLLAIIVVTMTIVNLVVRSVIGVATELLLPPDLADFAMSIVSGIVETALALVVVLVSAALYRAAAAPAPMPWRR